MTIKDFMLIDNGFSNRFSAKAIEIANYLQNRLHTRSQNHGEIILEEA